MNSLTLSGQTLAAALGLGLLAACSGPTEDVHITHCKDLTRELLGAPGGLEWTGLEQEFRRPEYAVIRLRYGHADGAGDTACWFEHEAIDEDALTLAEPLSAYSLVPYDIQLDGNSLTDAQRRALGNRVTVKKLKALGDRLRRAY